MLTIYESPSYLKPLIYLSKLYNNLLENYKTKQIVYQLLNVTLTKTKSIRNYLIPSY